MTDAQADNAVNADVPEKAQTKDQKKKDKYGGDADAFSISECSNIKDGPVKERRVTDFLCLILFLVFLGAMMACTLYGFKKGDVARYVSPLDRDGKFCGSDKEFQSYPKLYLTSLFGSPSQIFNSGVCVKSCPDSKTATIDCGANSVDKAYCAQTSVSSKIYKTRSVMGYCMPVMSDLKDDRPDDYKKWQIALNEFMTSNPAGRQVQDMYLSSRAIYGSMAMSFVYCLVFIYLMSWFAEYIAWAMVCLTQVGLIGASVFCFGVWMKKKNEANDVSSGTKTKDDSMMYMAGGIIFAIFGLIFLLAVWCGFNSLRTAINVIDASADFLAKTKRIIGVPIFYFLLTVIFVMIWLGCMLAINSIGTITADDSLVVQKRKATRTDAENKTVTIMFLFMFFGILWIAAFLKAKTSFIVMVSASTYYFDSNEDKDGNAEVGLGFKYAYMYHAGSLAFGSFIIALIQFIRAVFMYFAEQAKRASGDNVAVRIIVGCADCMLKCLEKICDYINKAAYAYMAVSGDSFCSSAWNGFLLNIKHTMQFGWANFLASMFIFIGKVSIVVLNVFSCFMIMKYVTKDMHEISSPASPLIVVGVVTYMAASIFLGLFDEAVLALMTCLAIDSDLNGHPKFGPPTFHDSLDGFHNEEKPNQVEEGGYYEKV